MAGPSPWVRMMHEKAFLWSKCRCWHFGENVSHMSLVPDMFIAWDCSPAVTAPTELLAKSCLLDPAIYHKPWLLVQLYIVNRWAPRVLLQQRAQTSQSQHSFCSFICLSVLYSLATPVRPKSMQGLSTGSSVLASQFPILTIFSYSNSDWNINTSQGLP